MRAIVAGEDLSASIGALGAIARLEALRADGAAQLVVPDAARGWLAERPAFLAHVEARYPRVGDGEGAVVHSLEKSGSPSAERVGERRDAEASGPVVSIVIAASEGGELLGGCLRSLHETIVPAAAIQIVLADDGSVDGVADLAREWSGRLRLTHVRADPGRGRVAARNDAADAAGGELLVFLGGDALALPGWLAPLTRTLRDEPDVGVAGGCLLDASGSLHEAGGVLFADGSVASFGWGAADPEAPLYAGDRDVDHVSAALLATRAGLFRSMGGFDGPLLDVGYASVDYCVRVAAAGRRVVYRPQSWVVRRAPQATAHPEAEAVGRARFVKRWAHLLGRSPPVPERLDEAAWHRLARTKPKPSAFA